MTSIDSLQKCQPRWATPRSPERETFGNRIVNVSAQLGQPLMPWQKLIAMVGGEIDPETGLPAYREVIFSVPRQSGKTTLVLSWEVERCVFWGDRQRVTYTAQTGKDAREKLIEDQVPILETSKIWKVAGQRFYRGTGSESILWKNGSRIAIQTSGDEAGHGKTIDLGVIDEAFADTDDMREQAILPGMLTKPKSQLLVISTMGTEASVYWNRKVELGRAAAEAGKRSGIAYFEWSAHPDEDPDDPETWAGCSPALNRTISIAGIEHARGSMTDGDFRRAMLNLPSITDERFIGATVWADAIDPQAEPKEPFVFAVEINPDRTWASVAAAGSNGVVELIEHRPGVSWLIDCLRGLRQHGDMRVVIDEYGPAAAYISDIQSENIKVDAYKHKDVVLASAKFYDDLHNGAVKVRTHDDLDIAAAAVHKKLTGESWVFSRAASVDVSPFLAAVLAYDKAGKTQSNDLWIDF